MQSISRLPLPNIFVHQVADNPKHSNHDSLLETASMLESQGHYADSLVIYLSLSDNGNTNVGIRLAALIRKGSENSDLFDLCKLHSKAGSPAATNALGFMFRRGLGVTQDYTEALKHFYKAREMGNSDAMNNLGGMYFHGEGIEPNIAMAYRFCSEAEKLGCLASKTSLGIIYHSECRYRKAYQYFKEAADQGESMAMMWLGVMFHNGDGMKVDYAMARIFYERAAELGNLSAKIQLEEMLKAKHGLVHNSKSENAYRTAANNLGMLDDGIQYNLGVGYVSSKVSAERDYGKAKTYLTELYNQGNKETAFYIAQANRKSSILSRDHQKAKEFYQIAADNGDVRASQKMAKHYSTVHGSNTVTSLHQAVIPMYEEF